MPDNQFPLAVIKESALQSFADTSPVVSQEQQNESWLARVARERLTSIIAEIIHNPELDAIPMVTQPQLPAANVVIDVTDRNAIAINHSPAKPETSSPSLPQKIAAAALQVKPNSELGTQFDRLYREIEKLRAIVEHSYGTDRQGAVEGVAMVLNGAIRQAASGEGTSPRVRPI